jgi:hypothetical protein
MLCTFSILRIFPKKLFQNCLSNRPPTLTCGSSRATQACFLLFHAAMKFWEATFTTFHFLDYHGLCCCYLLSPLCSQACHFLFCFNGFMFDLSLHKWPTPLLSSLLLLVVVPITVEGYFVDPSTSLLPSMTSSEPKLLSYVPRWKSSYLIRSLLCSFLCFS